jgi:hypothetical protein
MPALFGVLLVFGAPLPDGAELVKNSPGVAVYRSASSYESIARFYRKKFEKKRMFRIMERRESKDPKYVLDPLDPNTSMPVLRVLHLDYSGTWAAVYVRPLGEGALIVVQEQNEAAEVSGDSPTPDRIEIPRAVFEVGLRPLVRP